MAWSAWAQVLYVLIIAGLATSSTFDVTLNEGDTLSAVIVTGFNANVPCYLDTPRGDVIEFRPENQSNDRIAYIETAIISYCGANITNLTEDDEGEWAIYYTSGDEVVSNNYHLTIAKAGQETEESPSEPKNVREEDVTEWLRVINISTRTGLTIDIALSKKDEASQEETFSVITPNEQVLWLDNANIPGVAVHGSSDFVANRITVGPIMDASMLGRWSLCGEVDENGIVRRCQPVVISWNNVNNPLEEWNTTVINPRDIVTNYNALVNATVRGTGVLQNCHVITPNGDDLIITSDSTYPGITFLALRDTAMCTVALSPIHRHHIGDWVFYASFLHASRGRNEVHMPFTLFLYDKEDPYSQAYNVTTLNPLNRIVPLGTSTTLTLSGSGSTDSCEIRSPSGESFNLQSGSDTVTFLSPDSSVRCRVSIGPIGLHALGDWLFIAKFNNRGIFTESRQTVSIILEEEEWLRVVNVTTRMGLNVDIALGKKELDSSIEEKFTLTTPENEVVELKNANIPGVIVHGSSDFVDSRVTIGPMDASLLGRWTLCGEVDVGVLVKRCQPFTIAWLNPNNPSESWNTTSVAQRNIVTNYLAIVNSTVRGSGILQTCHLITPDGENLALTNTTAYPGLNFIVLRDTALCTITMGPIHRQFIGDWVLTATFNTNRGVRSEVHFPFNLFLYDEEDPYSQAYNVTTLSPLTRMVTLGTTINLTLSGSGTTDSCEIRSPSGESFDMQSSSGTVNFLSPDSSVRCRVAVGPIGLHALGDWLFIAKFNNRGIFTESRQTVSIILEEEEWLTVVNVTTRMGLNVDIALGKIELDSSIVEKFTLTTPENEVVELENASIPGVIVHGSSDFVDSRVTIGPMDASLLGRWTLCGEVDVGVLVKRCQPFTIAWLNPNNPSESWNTTSVAQRNIVTNYLAIVNSTVRGSGILQTCHLITPDGENLALTNTTAYPGLNFIVLRDTALCTITMGPIHRQFIGDWVLTATFNTNRGVRSEVHFPFNLFLYDEDDPYSQAYNVTTQNAVTRVINLGTSLAFSISGSGTTDSCEVRSPSGQLYNLQNGTAPVIFGSPNSNVRCTVTLGPFEHGIFGDWTFNAKFNNRGIFTEIRQPIAVLLEDPENPIIEDHRTIVLRDLIYLVTSVGEEHTIIADPNTSSRDITESCHIRTPSGLQYTIMEGFNLPGIQLVANNNNRCIINLQVLSPDLVGEWMLISREQRSSQPTEVRQPFTIFVEETIDASASHVTVSEGNDLFLRLANPTTSYDSCILMDPSGTIRTDREVDASHVQNCGFIVRSIQSYDSGVWQIRYKAGISYVANINVIVTDQWEKTHETLVLTRGTSVNETLGPENAVYCKLTDPTQRVIFEGHGRCILALDRVANRHVGTWAMNVGFQGNMLTRTYHFDVEAEVLDEKPVVTTYVAKEQPEVTLKCSVPVEYEVRSCLFQEPSGRVIIVNDGVAEDRYISHGSGTTVDGEVTIHECGIRITDPAVADLGLWRCAVETDHEVYYGFLTVLCPWAMQDPETAAAVISEPTLSAREEIITHLEGEPLTMTCAIQSPIQYCYFRRSNGMTYSVNPGIPSDEFEYVGSGFDAGECGIRFSSLPEEELGHWPEGGWSCHVGLPNGTEPEQRASIQVQITRLIEVSQYLSNGVLNVEAEVYHQQALKYCRYVRIDGIGFTSKALPDTRYSSYENLTGGHCGISIESPTILDLHPWTIAAKIIGKDQEIMSVTTHTLEMPTPESTEEPPLEPTTPPTPPPTDPTPEPTPDHSPPPTESTHVPTPHPEPLPEYEYGSAISNVWLWLSISLSAVLLVLVMVLFTKNRKTVIARASSWRDSIRRSLIKKPLIIEPLPDSNGRQTTPMSA